MQWHPDGTVAALALIAMAQAIATWRVRIDCRAEIEAQQSAVLETGEEIQRGCRRLYEDVVAEADRAKRLNGRLAAERGRLERVQRKRDGTDDDSVLDGDADRRLTTWLAERAAE